MKLPCVDRAIQMMETLKTHAGMNHNKPQHEIVPYIEGCIGQLRTEYPTQKGKVFPFELDSEELQLIMSLSTGISMGIMGRDFAPHAKEAARRLHDKLSGASIQNIINRALGK